IAQRGDALIGTTRELSDRRARLESEAVVARVAAFSTAAPAQDVVRFASQEDVAMILVDGASGAAFVSELLASADCDVVVSAASAEMPPGNGLVVPFGGGEHDWAALELAGHLARLLDEPLILAGARPDTGPDASRALAVASLVVQRTVGVTPLPVMI